MKEKETNKNNDKIGLAIWFLPLLTFPIFAKELALPDMISSMMLALIGGIVGFSLSELTKQRSTQVKLLTLGVMAIGIIGSGMYSLNRTESVRQELQTCRICGYITLKKEGDECNICMTEINEEYRIIGEYKSFDELIREEQLDFFTSDIYGEKRSFYDPKITTSIVDYKKYSKDDLWKPVVSEEELKELMNNEK